MTFSSPLPLRFKENKGNRVNAEGALKCMGGRLGLTFDLLFLDRLFVWFMSWLIISTVIYLAARMAVGEEASFKASLALTFVGVLMVGLSFSLSIGILGPMISLTVAFFLWLLLTKTFFHTGWLQALGLTILAIAIGIIISLILPLILGLTLSTLPPHV
jgi:hypothetical protein